MREEKYETWVHRDSIVTVEEFTLLYYKMSESTEWMFCYIFYMRKKFKRLPIVWPSVFLHGNMHYLLEFPDMKIIITFMTEKEKVAIAAYMLGENDGNNKFVRELAKHSEGFNFQKILKEFSEKRSRTGD